MKYRAEIDGLRALAVVPVILFHAGFELFGGGFVGVDVFFVISGYLITTILIEDIENGRFSILKFYERRARRILPALFFVMLCCLPFAWMWMLPDQLQDFSRSLVAVSLFASNILFWRESGYFGAAAEEKPLLHTWSLAVEEQYYVLFPVFLFLAWRFGKARVFYMIVAFAAISLAMSEWGWRNMPLANFYLAPTRAWELFAGSIAAFVVQKRGVVKNDALALIGLVAIVFSIFGYDPRTPIPSLYALVPVGGVILLILYASKETYAARLLGTKPFVGIGLISYSAYLWHQPLFAFARIRALGEPSGALMLLLGVVSMVLAILSWRFVEQPFRRTTRVFSGQAPVFVFSLAGLLAFGMLGTAWVSERGLPGRFGDDVIERAAAAAAEKAARREGIRSGICQFNGTGRYRTVETFLENWDCNAFGDGQAPQRPVAVYGDSHSADKAMALRLNGWNVTQLGGAGCPLILDENYGVPVYCTELLQRFVREVERHPYRLIVLANRFRPGESDVEYLQRVVDFWAAFDARVVLFTAMPEFEGFEEAYVKVPDVADTLAYDAEALDRFYEELGQVTIPANVTLVDTKDIFCALSGGRCNPVYDGTVLLTDYGHLSREGARRFGAVLQNVLEIQIE